MNSSVRFGPSAPGLAASRQPLFGVQVPTLTPDRTSKRGEDCDATERHMAGRHGGAARAVARRPGSRPRPWSPWPSASAPPPPSSRVVRAVLLAPLPYAEPDRRVMIWSRWISFDKTWLSDQEILDYRRLSRTHDRGGRLDLGAAEPHRRRRAGAGQRRPGHRQHLRRARRRAAAGTGHRRRRKIGPTPRRWPCWATACGRAATAATRRSSAAGSSSTTCRSKWSA